MQVHPPKSRDAVARGDRDVDHVEAWALRYVESDDLEVKVEPGPPPETFAADAAPRRLTAPGRPPALRVAAKSKRSLQAAQLRSPRYRAQLLHTFWHHELQAAELMCWALLAFPDAPLQWKRGLLRVCRDELRHMRLYQGEVERLGYRLGDFPVRDWFWQRVATCRTPLQFVALMGIGLEGGNLDHACRYAEGFAAAGDQAAARVQERVGREEIAHVRFAAHWFSRWTGGVEFARWQAELPPPLTPRLLRGRQLDRAARARAGLPPDFLDGLARW
jgi:uncharacterized ferritin-like protein (DUF455 family)